MTHRYLNPGHIVVSGDDVWLVDRTESVAAVVSGDGALSALIRWPLSAGDLLSRHRVRVVPDGVGVVVRCQDTVTWVRREGWVSHQVSGGWLSAAEPDAAWFVDDARPECDEPGWVALVGRDGSRREFVLPQPVGGVEFVGDHVVFTLNHAIVKRPTPRGGLAFEYPVSRAELSRAEFFAGDVELRPLSPPAPPEEDRSRRFWLETDRSVVLRDGLRARGLVWWAGADPDGDRIHRRALITAHDPDGGREMFRLDAGAGLIQEVSVVGDELWLAISRSRLLRVARDQGTEVVAVSADDQLRTIYASNSLGYEPDDAGRVPRPSAAQIEKHTESVRSEFADLEECWEGADGTTHPLSRGITDSSVEVTGDWPKSAVVVTFRHPARPGLLLRRTYRLYDDEGRLINQTYAGIGLMEDLDTGYITPADEAIDGILDT